MAQVALTDASTLTWDLETDPIAILTATVGVGNTRTLPNSVVATGVNGINYQMTFIQDGVGGRSVLFDSYFTVIGQFDLDASKRTIITIVVQDGEADVILTPIKTLISDSIQLSLIAGISVGQGEMAWNADEETFDFGLNGAILQGGQEVHYHVRNISGVQIDDGKAVMATGTVGASGRITIDLMDGSDIANAKFFLGIATEDIADGTDGKVTFFGKVRGINTNAWNEGDVLWIDNAVLGGLTNVMPTTKCKLPIAFVITKSVGNGVIAVRSTDGTYFLESHDVDISGQSDEDYIYWNNATSAWKAKQLSGTITSTHPVLIPFTFPANERTDLDSLHGGLHVTGSQSGIVLNSGQTITDTIGVSKIMLVVNAGSDLAGDITVTGTSVNRDTAAETGSDTSVITISALTTDGSTTDGNGNTVHSFTGAYITDKWFKGAITLSTTDVNLTDIDVYQITFEQFDDFPDITVDSLDATYLTENTTCEMDCYLYSIEVTDDVCDLSLLATLTHETGQSINFYRKRIGNIAKALDGTTDGVFVDLYLLPSVQTYFDSFVMKIWATASQTSSVTFS